MNPNEFQHMLNKATTLHNNRGDDFADRLLKAKKQQDKKYKSEFTNPRNQGYNRGILEPRKAYSMQLFRRISEKAWIINVIIGHLIDKVVPYLQPLSEKGKRGFEIALKDKDKKATDKDKKSAQWIREFLMNTGSENALECDDDIIAYAKKILRDLLTLDQTTTEKLWTVGGDLLSFEAVDAATILRCTEEGYEGDDEIRFVQQIDSQIKSQYTKREMLFQYDNPRTDINNFGYGYSKIEQCVGLVIAVINTFVFNAGAFSEDKLPRGMLLLNGDMGFEEVEQIEDYLIDVMGPSGLEGANNKWGIPIIPTGKGGDKSSITWQPLGQTNQDMQYSRWQDYLNMGIAAIYGVDIESTGIKNEKGAKIMESGSAEAHKYSDDKGIGSTLMFLKSHFQNFINEIDPRFEIVFHGFEQDDAKDTREAVSSQLSTYKSLNEIRIENDLEPMDSEEHPWADIPGLQNPQFLQAYQAGQQPEEEGTEEDDGFGFEKSIDDDVLRITI